MQLHNLPFNIFSKILWARQLFSVTTCLNKLLTNEIAVDFNESATIYLEILRKQNTTIN